MFECSWVFVLTQMSQRKVTSYFVQNNVIYGQKCSFIITDERWFWFEVECEITRRMKRYSVSLAVIISQSLVELFEWFEKSQRAFHSVYDKTVVICENRRSKNETIIPHSGHALLQRKGHSGGVPSHINDEFGVRIDFILFSVESLVTVWRHNPIWYTDFSAHTIRSVYIVYKLPEWRNAAYICIYIYMYILFSWNLCARPISAQRTWRHRVRWCLIGSILFLVYIIRISIPLRSLSFE